MTSARNWPVLTHHINGRYLGPYNGVTYIKIVLYCIVLHGIGARTSELCHRAVTESVEYLLHESLLWYCYRTMQVVSWRSFKSHLDPLSAFWIKLIKGAPRKLLCYYEFFVVVFAVVAQCWLFRYIATYSYGCCWL